MLQYKILNVLGEGSRAVEKGQPQGLAVQWGAVNLYLKY
jgi:hypothetical protein